MKLKSNKVTDQILELRAAAGTEIKCGQWHAGFTEVKNYAVCKGLPLIAIWTNGDACYYCRKLEKNFLDKNWMNWMETSNCIFWFATSSDKSEDDKIYGTGFNWCWQKGTDKQIKTYPFVRIYQEVNGEVLIDESMTGNKLDNSKEPPEGAIYAVNKIKEILNQNIKLGSESKSLRIKTNPDWTEDEIKEFRECIKENDGYCPCVPEHSDDSKCMCKWFREQKIEGLCHCGLYYKYYV